ncbi:MAG: hypothetical protein L3J47_11615 [Sulfurovum sp.]|nr:hypothetical protein [Sulfurovum sp.]
MRLRLKKGVIFRMLFAGKAIPIYKELFMFLFYLERFHADPTPYRKYVDIHVDEGIGAKLEKIKDSDRLDWSEALIR